MSTIPSGNPTTGVGTKAWFEYSRPIQYDTDFWEFVPHTTYGWTRFPNTTSLCCQVKISRRSTVKELDQATMEKIKSIVDKNPLRVDKPLLITLKQGGERLKLL